MAATKFILCLYTIIVATSFVSAAPGKIQEPTKYASVFDQVILSRNARHAKPPSVPTAPLDVNDNLHHTLDEVNSILGTLGGATSGAVMGLTGISITDCALTIKEEDLSSMSCVQFINKISECDSMAHLKPLLQQAKQKYKNKPNSNAPCFTGKGKGKGKKHG